MTVLLFVLVLFVLWLIGYQNGEMARQHQARIAVLDGVFAPWLRSIEPTSPDFDARLADYSAAFERFRAIPEPVVPIPARWVDPLFEAIERRMNPSSPSSAVENPSTEQKS
jgi:hypothetical protein